MKEGKRNEYGDARQGDYVLAASFLGRSLIIARVLRVWKKRAVIIEDPETGERVKVPSVRYQVFLRPRASRYNIPQDPDFNLYGDISWAGR